MALRVRRAATAVAAAVTAAALALAGVAPVAAAQEDPPAAPDGAVPVAPDGAAPGPDGAVPVAPDGAAPGDPEPGADVGSVPPVIWGPCPTAPAGVELDCAVYEVPLVHDRPEAGTVTIPLTRRRATGPG